MRTKERKDRRFGVNGVLTGGLVVTLAAGCAAPGVAPTRAPAPGDEVSVGYGVQSRKDVTGSISTITVDDATRASAARMQDLLEGRVAGLEVIRLSGGRFTVRIRGVNTLLGNPEPLLVIDGVPVMSGTFSSALAGIAPLDVVRIDVLKDAAAAGVYGMRGANGVIVVTTRRGR